MGNKFRKLFLCLWIVFCIVFSACGKTNDVDAELYEPTSLTISIYDSEESIYGFTWNTKKKPINPVLQIQEGDSLSQWRCKEYEATVTKETTYDNVEGIVEFYIVKAEIELKALKRYSYRAYDKGARVGTEVVSFETKDLQADTFSFAHVSDSQTINKTTLNDFGEYFGLTLSQIVGKNDFIVHTGDVVQTAQYEQNWTAMLNDNFKYLSKIPIMALAGNHETTYNSTNNNETFKHFNNKIPEQSQTVLGYYYSYTYGNAKFIMLNTNVGRSGLEPEQFNWLLSELQNNSATWTIVAMHCPMYSVGQWGADSTKNTPSLDLRTQLQGIFDEYGVDIVLQGHDHVISRTYPINAEGVPQSEDLVEVDGVQYTVNPGGVIYVMNGPAGNQTRTPHEIDSTLYAYAEASKTSSWAEFMINKNSMQVAVKSFDGAQTHTYQMWGIKKDKSLA